MAFTPVASSQTPTYQSRPQIYTQPQGQQSQPAGPSQPPQQQYQQTPQQGYGPPPPRQYQQTPQQGYQQRNPVADVMGPSRQGNVPNGGVNMYPPSGGGGGAQFGTPGGMGNGQPGNGPPQMEVNPAFANPLGPTRPQQGPWGYQQPQLQGGTPWQPPQQNQGRQTSWQPQQNQQQAPTAMPTFPDPQQTAAPQSLQAQILAGGTNAQQTQNYLQALQLAHAGSNNAQLSSGSAPAPAPTQLVGGPAMSNGDQGSAQYVNAFQAGPNQVSYNGGLGAQGGDFQYYNLNNSVGQQRAAPLTTLDLGNSFHPGGGPGGGIPSQYGPNNPFASGGGGGGGPLGTPSQYGPQSGLGAPGEGDYRAISPLVSDENLKTDVTEAKGLRGFLEKLGAHEYRYKNEKHGKGRFVSPMAQELAATELGKSAVINTPEGLKVDYPRLGGINLAAAADLNERVNQLEQELKLSRRRRRASQ